MKKLILSFIIIIINIVGIYFWLIYKPNRHVYSEEVIQNIAIKIDDNLRGLIAKIESQTEIMQSDLQNGTISPDSYNNYFLDIIEDRSLFQSILFFKNNKKFVIQREANSVITACDSSEVIKNVKWTRFENKKKISEWQEIFDKKNFNYEWVNQLELNPNEPQWIHHYLPTSSQAVLLLGKSWKHNNNQYSLAVRFSRTEIRKSFTAIERFKTFNILFLTKDKQTLNFTSDDTFVSDSIPFSQVSVSAIKEGIEQLESSPNKVFSYMSENKMYWAAVKDINSKLGLEKVIISIPEKAIETKAYQTNRYGRLYYGILAFLSAIILFIIYQKTISVPRFRIGKGKKVSINNLLQDNENRHLEFKSSLRWDYRQEKVNPDLEKVILKTIAAFGNSDGGILLIGVDDDKNILGLDNDFNTLKKKDSDFYEIYIRNLFHKYFGVKYTTENIRMDFLKDKQKEVCLIEIFKADDPLFLKIKDKSGQMVEKFYVRSGNSSQQIDSLKDINDYIFDRFRKE